MVTTDTDWFSDPPNTVKLHILEWPFIVASLRHNCAIIMLSNQHLDIKSSQVEFYCHSATCGEIQWNEMSCLTGPRYYINTDIQHYKPIHKLTY